MSRYSYTQLARKSHSFLYEETSPKKDINIVETTVSLSNTELSPEGRTTLITNKMLKSVPHQNEPTEEITATWLRT